MNLPFDLEKARAGHPLIARNGVMVKNFKDLPGAYSLYICYEDGMRVTLSKKGLCCIGQENDYDLFLYVPEDRLLTSAIRPGKDFDVLKGMYIQAGKDVRGMTQGWSYYGFLKDCGVSGFEIPYKSDNFTVYESLDNYLNNKPAPQEEKITFGTKTAVRRGDKIALPQEMSVNDILELAAKLK